MESGLRRSPAGQGGRQVGCDDRSIFVENSPPASTRAFRPKLEVKIDGYLMGLLRELFFRRSRAGERASSEERARVPVSRMRYPAEGELARTLGDLQRDSRLQ